MKLVDGEENKARNNQRLIKWQGKNYRPREILKLHLFLIACSNNARIKLLDIISSSANKKIFFHINIIQIYM